MTEHDPDLIPDRLTPPEVETEVPPSRWHIADVLITTGRTPAEGADPLVDHPAHYNQHPAGIECIDVIAPMIFPVGNAIKHLWRAGLKPGTDDVQDVEKAIWYLQYHLAQLKNPAVVVDGSSLTDGEG